MISWQGAQSRIAMEPPLNGPFGRPIPYGSAYTSVPNGYFPRRTNSPADSTTAWNSYRSLDGESRGVPKSTVQYAASAPVGYALPSGSTVPTSIPEDSGFVTLETQIVDLGAGHTSVSPTEPADSQSEVPLAAASHMESTDAAEHGIAGIGQSATVPTMVIQPNVTVSSASADMPRVPEEHVGRRFPSLLGSAKRWMNRKSPRDEAGTETPQAAANVPDRSDTTDIWGHSTQMPTP